MTNYYCCTVGKETENILKEVINFFGILMMNPKLTGVGQAVLESKGYLIGLIMSL
jgi:hypothetical protein